jgi:hypothetical protein
MQEHLSPFYGIAAQLKFLRTQILGLDPTPFWHRTQIFELDPTPFSSNQGI